MIELSRYIPFGQYINNGSQVARLDPRTKLIGAILVIICITFISRFVALACFLIFCLILQQTSHIAIGYILRGMKAFAPLLLFAFAIQELFTIVPAGTPLLWHWWVLSISWA